MPTEWAGKPLYGILNERTSTTRYVKVKAVCEHLNKDGIALFGGKPEDVVGKVHELVEQAADHCLVTVKAGQAEYIIDIHTQDIEEIIN